MTSCLKDSQFGKDVHFKQVVYLTANTREDTANITKKHRFSIENKGTCASKSLQETVRLASANN